MAINDDTLRQIEKARRALNAAVDGVDHDLLRAWTQAWNEITAEWRAVTLELAAMSKDGRWPSRAQITRATRAAEVLKLTRARMEELGKVLNVRVTTALPDVVADANRVANRLTRTQLPSGAAGNVIKTNLLDPKALDAIVARTTGRVHALSKPLSALAEQSMKATLIRGVIVGDNPNRAASIMVSRVKGDFDGGLNRARVISRTEMLDANRTAALAHDKANADILQGWQWVSALDSRTCFPAGTLITTSAGDKPIEQIATGDVVLSHTGQWRRAYEPMGRTYSGVMVTLTAGDLTVTCTSDHPVLIEREGELQWMEARGIRRGDSVLSHLQSGAHGVDHSLGERPVERRCVESQHRDPAALHEGVLSGVAVSGAGVPVGLVDLDTDPSVGEIEVDRPLPARHGVLLDEVAAERFECEPHAGFGLGLAGVASVAARRAEAAPVRRDAAEGFAADGALDVLGRASALFRAVGQSAALRVEDVTADLARSEGQISVGAFGGAVVVPGCMGARDGEGRTAADARLGRAPESGHALPGARLAGALGAGLEGLAAVRTFALNARRRVASLASVRLLPLMGVVAVSSAEAPGRLASGPRRRDLEKGAATFTSKFHRHILSSVAIHYQTLTVHNFEVEVDHSYVANGIAVHNCPSCWSKHGEIFDLDVPGPEDHQQGRCTRVPVAKTWRDLGFDIDEPASLLPDAQSTFAGLPREQQLQVMGKSRLDLLDSGQASWGDLATKRSTDGWRDSWAPTPLADLTR